MVNMDVQDTNKRFPENYRVFLTTHKGLVRDNNEDNFTINNISKKIEYKNVSFALENEAPLLAAVFDGMGGESKGEYASYISAKLAKDLYNALFDPQAAPMDEMVSTYVQSANNEIRAFLEENKCQTGGSTLVAAIIKNEVLYPFSLGDSRIYYLRDGQLTQVSKDQTLAMKKYEANIYTLEEAEKSPDSHKLTAFLGVDYYRQGVSPQFYEPIVMQNTDKLLLCSDGLYDELSLQEIQEVLKSNPDNPSEALVQAALQHGGRDNVTVMVVERAL